MNRRSARAVAFALTLGACGVGFIPVAVASPTHTSTLKPGGESWFEFPIICQTLAQVGCESLPLSLPDLNPYPAGTLHIGAAASEETARSYLGFDLSVITGDITAATLTVPLDTAPSDGSLQPDTAKVQVCLATESLRPAAGSILVPAATDCSGGPIAKYAAAPSPHLTADLGPLAARLPTSYGIALVPAAKQSQVALWQVVFSEHDRTGAGKTDPATLDVAWKDAAPVAPTPGPTSSDSVPTVTPPTTVTLPTAVALPSQPVGIAPSIAPTPTRSEALSEPAGYAYPQVWLLPILVLMLTPMIVGALTRDLAPDS